MRAIQILATAGTTSMWLWAVEGQRPQAADLIGAGIAIIGSLVIVGFAAKAP